jgi:hypothetical protein
MARKIVLILSAFVLPSFLFIALESGAASAVSNGVNQPGQVTCSPAHGVWTGTIRFVPPLMNGGTANKEKFVINATLGNSASPCVTTAGTVALGTIKGLLKFHIPGSANNCATIFSGAALPAPVGVNSRFQIIWSTPPGSNPTNWKQLPPFVVTGSAGLNDITISGGKVTGSYSPYPPANATLSDTNWPGASGAVATGCASTGGLASLTLSTSAGTW